MNFGEALQTLQRGQRVRRSGWNGKSMWLLLVREWSVGGDELQGLPLLPFIGMRTADQKFIPWLCSQADALAEDWELVPEGGHL